MMSRSFHLVFCLLSLAVFGAPFLVRAANEPDFCDAMLEPASGSSLGYRMREDRCEGLYVQRLSILQTLRIVSLTERFDDYDADSIQSLALAWRSPGAEPVRLRAQALRPRLYYRMDSLRPGADADFNWSVRLLAALRIDRNDLGVLAWTRVTPTGEPRDVLLPLRVTAAAPTHGSDPGRPMPYRLQLLPGQALDELFLTIATLDTDGQPQRYLRDAEPIGCGYCPAGRPITVLIEGIDTEGLYAVEITATLAGGGSTGVDFLLYRAPD